MKWHVFLNASIWSQRRSRSPDIHLSALPGWKFHIHSLINVDDFIADLQWKTLESSAWEGGIVPLLISGRFLIDRLPVNSHIHPYIIVAKPGEARRLLISLPSASGTIDVTHFEPAVSLLGQSRNLGLKIFFWSAALPARTHSPTHLTNHPASPWTYPWVFGKMGCLGNSKTEDQRNEEKAQREANKKIEKQLQKDKQIYRATHRLLLLGRFLWILYLAWRIHFVLYCCTSKIIHFHIL